MSDQAKNLRMEIKRNREQTAKTIAIVSGKGGVGKSNFAINFALELISFDKKVIVCDLDVGMGNIEILLGLSAKKTIVDMLKNKLSIFSIIESGPNNLSYIAGGTSLTDFFTMDQLKMDFFLEQFELLGGHYDYIIFDLGAGISKESMFFNLASDDCIVITTPEPTAITDAYSVIKYIVNKDQEMPIYVVINRSPSKAIGVNTLANFEKVISQFLQINIIKLGILPEDQYVREAVMQQTPYVLANNRSSITKAMKQLTHSYVSKDTTINDQNSMSFIQKLKKFFVGR